MKETLSVQHFLSPYLEREAKVKRNGLTDYWLIDRLIRQRKREFDDLFLESSDSLATLAFGFDLDPLAKLWRVPLSGSGRAPAWAVLPISHQSSRPERLSREDSKTVSRKHRNRGRKRSMKEEEAHTANLRWNSEFAWAWGVEVGGANRGETFSPRIKKFSGQGKEGSPAYSGDAPPGTG